MLQVLKRKTTHIQNAWLGFFKSIKLPFRGGSREDVGWSKTQLQGKGDN